MLELEDLIIERGEYHEIKQYERIKLIEIDIGP